MFSLHCAGNPSQICRLTLCVEGGVQESVALLQKHSTARVQRRYVAVSRLAMSLAAHFTSDTEHVPAIPLLRRQHDLRRPDL